MALPARAADVAGDVYSFLRANPEVAATLAVGTVALAAVVVAVLRFKRPMGVRFREAIAAREEVAVLIHPNPDPDAMAVALGVARLAEQVDTETTLQYSGQIRHQENRAFRTVLDLELEQIDHVTDLAAEDVVLVDHNEPRGLTGADGILPFAVIDHHPGDGRGEEFTDVRTDYGACASIMAEYFRDIGAKPVPPDHHESEIDAEYTLPSKTATGLLYGILADTGHLTQGASPADYEAAAYLQAGIDEDLLDRIANPEVSTEVLDVKARAIAGRKVEGSFAVSDVGTVSNVDAIPQAADELMQLEGVTAVVVCGERDGVVHLSGRSRDDRVHMGRALESAVEGFPRASAGGHARMGGGQIPLSNGSDAVTVGDGGDDNLPVARNELTDRLFDSLEGDV